MGRIGNLTHDFDAASALNTFINPFASLTGSYWAPKAFKEFPTGSDPKFNAALFQAGALGATYATLAGLARYVSGVATQEREKSKAAKAIADRLGVEEAVFDPGDEGGRKLENKLDNAGVAKQASLPGDFLSLILPVSALAVGISGGYGLATRQLTKDRKAELDAGLAQTEAELDAERQRTIKDNQASLAKTASMGSALVGLAGLALGSIFVTSTLLAKRQFDKGDDARINQKASEAAFKALTRSRLSQADTDLHYVDREKALNRLAKPKPAPAIEAKPAPALPAAPTQEPQPVVRPFEAVPV